MPKLTEPPVKVDERLWPKGLQRSDGKPNTMLSDEFARYEAQRRAALAQASEGGAS